MPISSCAVVYQEIPQCTLNQKLRLVQNVWVRFVDITGIKTHQCHIYYYLYSKSQELCSLRQQELA